MLLQQAEADNIMLKERKLNIAPAIKKQVGFGFFLKILYLFQYQLGMKKEIPEFCYNYCYSIN